MTAAELIQKIEIATGHTAKPTRDGYSCRCPAHEDRTPSLSVGESPDGRKVLLKCHAGCSSEAVVAALGLQMADLFVDSGKTAANRRGRRPRSSRIVATYPYHDRDGKLLYEVCRCEPKAFLQRAPDAAAIDGWTWKTKGRQQVPYRLPELISAAQRGETIFVAEGEKDVATLASRGFPATCNAGGAGKWRDEFGAFFNGAKAVVVIADKDTAGRAHAASVAVALKVHVPSVKVVELPDLARAVKDATDYFEAGGTSDGLREIVNRSSEFIPKEQLTPSAWFKRRFPKIAEKHGDPVDETTSRNRAKVRDISEDFMAAIVGPEGMPESPTVFLPMEEKFFTYNRETGIFEARREESIAATLSGLFLECVRECGETADTSKLQFSFRDSAALAGIIRRAKGHLAVPDEFFSKDHTDFVPVANGMLRLKDRKLLPFSPQYRCRHKLAVSYDPHAQAPMFLETLLLPALSKPDIALIQRWSGLILVGLNISQKILLLTGTAGGGKSTLVAVFTGIIGGGNVGMLRTDLLGDRFEIGRLMGKTLLYGADVMEDFLSKRSASILKSLTGGDMMTAEFKNSNEAPQVKCQFNMIVTSNSRLTVHLEGDGDAWRRRLAIVKYERPKPPVPIPNLSEQIVAQEGPGVLNFMLDGLEMLRSANWQFTLNERQQSLVDDLLLESDSHREFVKRRLIKDSTALGMTKAQVFAAYCEFCESRGWIAMPKNRFGSLGADAVAQELGLHVRKDIRGEDGKQNDGWKNLRLKTEAEEKL